jgi:F-type H+-transporting ATPase subunit delta
MSNSQISRVYARSLLELGKEKSVDVCAALTALQETINSSNPLEHVEKVAVLKDVMAKLKTPPLVESFLLYLVNEKRIQELPMIYKELIVLDDHERGFFKGVVEGMEPTLAADIKKSFVDYLEKMLNQKIQLSYQQNDKITAGYKVTIDNYQLDATVDNQFDRIKSSILGD